MENKKIPQRIKRLLEVFEETNGKIGDLEKNEWRIVLNPFEMLKLEEDLIKKNKDKDKERFKCGVLGEDNFYIYTRFFFERPVENKTEFVLYNKVFWTGQLFGGAGVAALVLSSDNKIILTRSWRPSVGNWILETPGTIKQKEEREEETLKRCLDDDIGLEIDKKELLSDYFFPDRGIMSGFVPFYLIKLKKGKFKPKDLSLNKKLAFSKEELESIIKKGYYMYENKKHFCCDGYLVFALYLAEKKGLI